MALAGYPATVKIGANTIQDIQSYDLPFKMAMLATTAFGGSSGATVGTETFIPGLLGMATKLTGNWNKADTTGQLLLEAAFFARTTVTLIASPNGTSTYTFAAWVSDYNIKADVKGLITADYSLTMNGNVTLA